MAPAHANRLLDSLPAKDRATLDPSLKAFALVQGEVLHPAGSSIKHVYFPLSGVVSLLAVMRSGQQIETAIVGCEGVVGASIGSNGRYAFGQATVQIAGSALQIRSGPFLDVLNASPTFRTAINRFQSVILMQAQQSAACHALHTVEARLCRWLLQSRDAIESDSIPLTQEFLSHMLGVQRSAVSLAATGLQTAGLIKYARGNIAILDVKRLRKQSCECYGNVRAYLDRA
jgi:CRP-like cAMP-binding protein